MNESAHVAALTLVLTASIALLVSRGAISVVSCPAAVLTHTRAPKRLPNLQSKMKERRQQRLSGSDVSTSSLDAAGALSPDGEAAATTVLPARCADSSQLCDKQAETLAVCQPNAYKHVHINGTGLLCTSQRG